MTAAQLNAFLMRNMDADVNLNVANEVSGVLLSSARYHGADRKSDS